MIPLLAHFGPVLVGQQELGFRDVAHYYRPLYELVGREWRAGRIPLWNPYENAGQPLMADSTSAVWYPPQLVFALALDPARAMGFYVVSHLLLAAFTTYFAARCWRCSRGAAVLAAVTYSLSGYVLFQYCNPAYLVGSSWLPLALVAVGKVVERRQQRWDLVLAVVLALLVVGGDPQSAYHVMLAGGMYLVLNARGRRGALVRPAGHLAQAGLLAGALAAIQILPALECTRQSTRMVHEHPRSIWHLARQPTSALAKLPQLAARPRPGTHDAQVYGFSMGPWRVVEFAWPNFSGRMFPLHQRWTRHAFGEHQVWNASLYLGTLPVVFALSGIVTGRRRRVVRWWTVLLLFALLASCGEYGLAWVWQTLRDGLGRPQRAESFGPVGGLYWWLVVLLPGYSSFRYPAKWLALATFAASLLAAKGFDDYRTRRSQLPRRLLQAGVACSLVAFIIALVTRSAWSSAFQDAPPDRVFGPLAVEGAIYDVLGSMLHHAVVGLAGLGAMYGFAKRANPRLLVVALVVFTALDLTVAHAWQVATVSSQRNTRAALCSTLAEDARRAAPQTVRRVYRDRSWRPREWARTSSRQRLEELVRWDRATLWPKYHFDCRQPAVSLLASPGAMYSADHALAIRVARQQARQQRGAQAVPAEYLKSAAAEYLLLPPGKRGGAATQRVQGPWPDSLAVEKFLDPSERAWLVRDVVLVDPPPRRADTAQREGHMRRILQHDLQRQAVVESHVTPREKRLLATLDFRPRGKEPDEFCRVTRDSPQVVRIRAHVNRPALLVLADTFYPGWRATVHGPNGGREVHAPWRTNGWMRGVLLPSAGEYTITYDYRPRAFYGGAAISLGTLACLLMVLVAACSRLTRSRRRRARRTIHTDITADEGEA